MIYSKKKFIEFLLKNNINDYIINKFETLPKSLRKQEQLYELYINVIWYDIKKTYYNFELNYYSKETMEFLFTSKVYPDIEVSIDNLIVEMKLINKL